MAADEPERRRLAADEPERRRSLAADEPERRDLDELKFQTAPAARSGSQSVWVESRTAAFRFP